MKTQGLIYIDKWDEGWQLWLLNGLVVFYLDKPILVQKRRIIRLSYMLWPSRTGWFRSGFGGLLCDIRINRTSRYGFWLALPFFRLVYRKMEW